MCLSRLESIAESRNASATSITAGRSSDGRRWTWSVSEWSVKFFKTYFQCNLNSVSCNSYFPLQTVVQAGWVIWTRTQCEDGHDQQSRTIGPDAPPDHPAWPSDHWPPQQQRQIAMPTICAQKLFYICILFILYICHYLDDVIHIKSLFVRLLQSALNYLLYIYIFFVVILGFLALILVICIYTILIYEQVCLQGICLGKTSFQNRDKITIRLIKLHNRNVLFFLSLRMKLSIIAYSIIE